MLMPWRGSSRCFAREARRAIDFPRSRCEKGAFLKGVAIAMTRRGRSSFPNIAPAITRRYDRPRLHVEPDATRVVATSKVRRVGDHARPLILDGINLQLESIAIDSLPLAADAYAMSPSG